MNVPKGQEPFLGENASCKTEQAYRFMQSASISQIEQNRVCAGFGGAVAEGAAVACGGAEAAVEP